MRIADGFGRRDSTVLAKGGGYGQTLRDDYVMEVQGSLREAAFFEENLVLRRRITTKLGEARLIIEDTVENLAFERVPHRILYHVNPGFPLVDAGARLLTPALHIEPHDEVSAAALSEHNGFSEPIPAFEEQAFYHRLLADEEGNTIVALVNDDLGDGGGLGLYVKYPLRQLPDFLEWKMMGEGYYVVGLEPSNSPLVSRAQLHAQGQMPYLQPRERREYRLEIGVLPNGVEIANLEAWMHRVADKKH